MGIEQSTCAWFGFFLDATPETKAWAKELDYKLPPGFMLVGVDSDEIVCGVSLFDSGSNRWEPLDAERVSLDPQQLIFPFSEWAAAIDDETMEVFMPLINGIMPQIHIFIQNG